MQKEATSAKVAEGFLEATASRRIIRARVGETWPFNNKRTASIKLEEGEAAAAIKQILKTTKKKHSMKQYKEK